ncbi:MAG TPA: Gfo/Idh/MocA family oxidoreductase, partial [Gemmatimonadales bacterium]
MIGTSRLGVGVIGFGFMGRTHARAWLAAGAQGLSVELRAVTGAPGTDPPAGAALCPSAVELLARDDVDAVSICTYTDTHVELALAALRMGKHVLVEKPVALRHEDVARLAAAEREAGLI